MIGAMRRLLGERGSLRRLLATGSAWSVFLSSLGTAILFVVTLVLTRSSTALEFGTYATVMSLASLLGIPASVGFDRLLIRTVAAEVAVGHHGLVAGLLRRSRDITFVVAVALSLSCAAGLLLIAPTMPSLGAFLVGCFAVPLAALNKLRHAALIGFHRVVAGQVPEGLVRPSALLLLAVLMAVTSANLSALDMVVMSTLSIAAAYVVGVALLGMYTPSSVRQARAEFNTWSWIRQAFPLMAMAGAALVMSHAPLIVLAARRGPELAAIFAVSVRLTSLVAFALIATNVVLGPTIARLWAEGDLRRLRKALTGGARAALLLSLPVGVPLIFASEQCLSLFGTEYESGGRVLTILAVGQIVNVAMGSVGLLLIMSGKQLRAALAQLVVAVATVPSSIALIELAGAEGAALSATGSLISLNVLWMVLARRSIGFAPTALGFR